MYGKQVYDGLTVIGSSAQIGDSVPGALHPEMKHPIRSQSAVVRMTLDSVLLILNLFVHKLLQL
jgi:hypothetical protein